MQASASPTAPPLLATRTGPAPAPAAQPSEEGQGHSRTRVYTLSPSSPSSGAREVDCGALERSLRVFFGRGSFAPRQRGTLRVPSSHTLHTDLVPGDASRRSREHSRAAKPGSPVAFCAQVCALWWLLVGAQRPGLQLQPLWSNRRSATWLHTCRD